MNKDFIILALGRVLHVLLALVSVKALTIILEPKEVGNYYLITTIIAFFDSILLNPFGNYFSRFLINWNKSGSLLNATVAFLFLRFTLILLSLILAVGIYFYFDYSNYYSLMHFTSLIFILLLGGSFGPLIGTINTLGHRFSFTILSLVNSGLGLILAIVFVKFISAKITFWFIGLVTAQILVLIASFKIISKNRAFNISTLKEKLNKTYRTQVMSFVLPSAIAAFLMWGQNTSYRLIVEAKYTIEDLAFIGLGMSICGSVFAAIETLSSQFYGPLYLKEIAHATKDDRSHAWNKIAFYMIPIYILLTFFVIALAPELTRFLISSKFYDAYVYVRIGAIIEFFRVMSNLLNMVSHSELRTAPTIKPYFLGFISSITILIVVDFSKNLIMIPIVLACSYLIIYVSMLINMKKLLPITVFPKNISKAFLWSLPFGLFYLTPKPNMISSILFIGMGLAYLSLVIYLVIFKKSIKDLLNRNRF